MASRKMQLNLNIEELPNIKKRIADLTAERDAAVARAEQAEQAVARVRDEREAIHEDLRQILLALRLGDHARPYSSHEVVQREVLPTIRRALDGTP